MSHGGRLLVAERGGARGYAVMAHNALQLAAADDVGLARALVWRVAAEADPEQDCGAAWATAPHDWLVDLAVALGWRVETRGAVAAAGFDPPATYLPSGAWL